MLINIHTHRISSHIKGLEIHDSLMEKPITKYFSEGIHPKFAANSLLDFSELETRLLYNNCLAIGECGLDKIIDIPLEKQYWLFEKQIALSEKCKLPLILHCVKAWNEVLTIRKKWKPTQPWIFHGFRKTSLLEAVLAEQMYLGIGAAILHDQKLQDAVEQIPLEKLFLETDNSTITIEEIYLQVAKLKNIEVTLLEQTLEANFNHVFRLL